MLKNTLNLYEHGEDNDRAFYTDVDPVDMFLGIGERNKEKKAAKKIKKAEKQLEKGHTKAATRKLAKAEKLQSKVASTQSAAVRALNTQGTLKQGAQAIEDAKAALTVPASGNAAYDPMNETVKAQSVPETGGGGGGGGDSSTMSDTSTDPVTGDEPTGALADVKELQGVTVTGHKTNPLIIAAVVGGILLLVIFGAKLFKTKK